MTTATSTPTKQAGAIQSPRYLLHGACDRAWGDMSKEVLLSGPAGTGKSLACLLKLYTCASLFPGMRGLIARKTRKSITQSVMVTFETKVIPAHLWQKGSTASRYKVYFHGQDNEYRFPNGSKIIVAGLDDPEKVKSSEYDMAYINEATELSENDWELVTTRLRNWVMPYQQLIADCNPSYPTHWLRQRYLRGDTHMHESRHEDNPRLFDPQSNRWTSEGLAYLHTLDALTGVRKQRLRHGKWAANEGIVYEDWSDDTHLIDRHEVPADARRFRVVDFGYTNPMAVQWWYMDGDGRLIMYRELYRTKQLVRDVAAQINTLSAGERIEFTLADHDAEDRATLEDAGIHTIPAVKDVSPGIQSVQERLRVQDDGKPRLYVMRDSLVERDEDLASASKPTCFAEEVPGYVWEEPKEGRPNKEFPVKEHDHSCDCARYLVFYLDGPVIDGHLAYVRDQNRIRKLEKHKVAA